MIDFTKPVQRKSNSGSIARILAHSGDYVWLDEGRGPYTTTESVIHASFVNAPEPVVSWHNVYPSRIACGYETRETADMDADNGCIALLKLTYSPGHATVEIVEEEK